METWHSLSFQKVLTKLGSHAAKGLSSAEVEKRQTEYGPNALPEPKRAGWMRLFFRQFKSPLIYLLLLAAGIAVSMAHWSDAGVILVVVLLNALIGAFQEARAERSLAALRKISALHARVVREGQTLDVDAKDLVPGDLILLESGDAVPADARLIETVALQASEAALTGESVPVNKVNMPVAAELGVADRHSMLFAGTHVTKGRARAVVVATGKATELGQIAQLAERAKEPKTPLEQRIENIGHYLVFFAIVLFVAIVAIGLFQDMAFPDIVMLGISQVVAMVPEGLPVAVTVALALGVQRMAKRRAIVRKLSAIETLGSTTVICSDKTGTLTRNEMTLTHIVLTSGKEFEISGTGYKPEGAFFENGRHVKLDGRAPYVELLQAGVLCSDAKVRKNESGAWEYLGDPTEIAILVAAMKAGEDPEALRKRFPRSGELPFHPENQLMASQHAYAGVNVVLVKGAPEKVFELCLQGATPLMRQMAERMASKGLRVLAVAVCEGKLDEDTDPTVFRNTGRLLGLLGQKDPPRPEAREAVALCRSAGIRPVMVTGDHKNTAIAIARDLGIYKENDQALDGRELEKMSDEELIGQIDRVSVFARVQPAQKLRIVEALQGRRQVVAMTGDGVNDAPALVQANVGVAMGLSGTEVAKEAARVVIADDNFATIVAAVEEGRVVFRNLRKLLLYLFSSNLAEVLVLLLSLILGYSAPLAAVQILWINLITDGTLTISLIMEPKEGDEMRHSPTRYLRSLFGKAMLTRMGLMTAVMTASTLGWYIYRWRTNAPMDLMQTEAFTLLAMSQLFNVFNCRSETQSVFHPNTFKNRWLWGGVLASLVLHAAVLYIPPLSKLFHTVMLDLEQLGMMVAISSSVLWAEELRKYFTRSYSKDRTTRKPAPVPAMI